LHKTIPTTGRPGETIDNADDERKIGLKPVAKVLKYDAVKKILGEPSADQKTTVCWFVESKADDVPKLFND
jgi:hypothetical protein